MSSHVYRIFLSSPGDVLPERDRAQTVVDRLNAEHPGQPVFSLTRWEQSFYLATGGFQDQISNPGDHDLVVFVFWKRLGTDLPPAYNRPDGSQRTGTEYEFEEARDARERRPDHLPDILVYRKTAKILFNEETVDMERAQKKALEQFWERWFRSDTGHLIAGFQSIASPNDFEQQFEQNLRQWLHRRHAGRVVWNITRQGSPYRGLVPFEEEHAGLFFGRDVDIARARARFIESAIGQESGRRGTPFLLILGASGSGKSSFLRAGLIPQMRAAGAPAFFEDGTDGLRGFRIVTVIPREMGDDLCIGLATSLYRAGAETGRGNIALPELADGDYPTAQAFAALAASSPDSATAPILRALDRVSAEILGRDSAGNLHGRFGLLLAVDQLEELFMRTEPDRRAFVRLLVALAASGRVWVAATMRNDFYDRLRQDPDLNILSERGRLYDLAPPTLADYRDIIRQPAQAAGLKFETTSERDLAAEIEAEAGSEGALPMIAFLLEQLFQERRNDLMLLDTFDRLGGAAGALAQRGDQVFDALHASVQAAFPRVVRRLVRKSLQDLVPTATSAPLSAFPSGSAERQLVEALTHARLIRMFTLLSEDVATRGWVRWSHEALLTRWPRLRNSVDADRRDYETLDRLQRDYSLWRTTPQTQQHDRLLADLALAEAKDLVMRWGSDVEGPLQQFVNDSAFRADARRRHERRVTVTWLAGLSVLATTATLAGFIAVKQRNIALREKLAADNTAGFMVDLFNVADPISSDSSQNHGSAVTVREVLDRGAAKVDKSLQMEPAVRADLLTAMGQAYTGLGIFDSAKKLLAEARKDQTSSETPVESRVRTLTASGATLTATAEYDLAEKYLREAVQLARKHLPADAIVRSEALDDLADVLVQAGKYPEAKQVSAEALIADRKRGPEEAARLARTLDTLGTIYYAIGDLSAAESTMREALDLHQRTSGARSAWTGIAMNNLGATLFLAGRYEEAKAMYEQALPIYREDLGEEHPEIAVVLNNIGMAALMAGEMEEAEPLLRQALAMDEKLKDATHDDLVPPLNGLAMIDGFRGHLSQARTEIQRAEQIARLPDHGVLLYEVILNAVDIALRQGTAVDAAGALAEARGLLTAAFPLSEHPTEAWRYAIADTVTAELLATQGDISTAQTLMVSAQPVIERRFGPDGFFSLLFHRRMQFIAAQKLNSSEKSLATN
jgi:tetratricopeptide (TPR) repeat protein